MKILPLSSILLIAFLFSCSSDSIKQKINKAGDIAGQATGEFMEGASKGIVKAFDAKIQPSTELRTKGLDFGKATITSDTNGTDNLLIVYVIFNQDFKGRLTAKA